MEGGSEVRRGQVTRNERKRRKLQDWVRGT